MLVIIPYGSSFVDGEISGIHSNLRVMCTIYKSYSFRSAGYRIKNIPNELIHDT